MDKVDNKQQTTTTTTTTTTTMDYSYTMTSCWQDVSQDKCPLPVEMNPREYGITERELEYASLDEINKKIANAGCSWAEEQMLLQWRRTLKSRSYTKKCREKNRGTLVALEREKAELQIEADCLKREIAMYLQLMQERLN